MIECYLFCLLRLPIHQAEIGTCLNKLYNFAPVSICQSATVIFVKFVTNFKKICNKFCLQFVDRVSKARIFTKNMNFL